MAKVKNILITFLLILPFLAFSQKRDKLELVKADILEGRGKVRVLKGNVVFKQNETMMYTDSAYFYPRENALDAFGNVRIVQPEGSTITSRKLFYNGNSKLAKFREKVVLVDKNSTVYTDALDYNMDDKTAVYSNGAKIEDPPNTLTSKYGFYNSRQKTFEFKQNVVIVNPQDQLTVYSEHLIYNTETKVVTFLSPSTIISKGDTILANSGEYNTVSDQSVFHESKIVSGDYILYGNKIDYNQQQDRGIITGNVKMVSSKDEVVIYGDKAIHRGDLGYTKVFGNAVMVKETQGDSLYLSADTLVSIDKKKTTGEKKLLAYQKSKVYKTDLQAVADSLVYNFTDSIIYFYRDPVMWNFENQITADSIYIQMANNKIDKMYLRENSFIISTDPLANYNQVKGKYMKAYFTEDTLRKVDVDGNSECIYFVLENDTALTGMNRVLSSNMKIMFKSNKVSTITFLKKPEAVFTPPHLIVEPERRLSGFKWHTDRRPVKADVIRPRPIAVTNN